MGIHIILAPIDGSPPSDRAVDMAADLAKRYDATLVIVHVQVNAGRETVPEDLARLERSERVRLTEVDMLHTAAEQLLERMRLRAEQGGAPNIVTVHRLGDPATQLVEIVRERRADLIVMGRRGLSGLTGLVFGSVSYKLMHHVDCPCLTIR